MCSRASRRSFFRPACMTQIPNCAFPSTSFLRKSPLAAPPDVVLPPALEEIVPQREPEAVSPAPPAAASPVAIHVHPPPLIPPIRVPPPTLLSASAPPPEPLAYIDPRPPADAEPAPKA